jgi:cytochrome c oxidase subunit 2
MSIPPADAMQVRVIGQKWNWTYQYPSATIDGVQYPGFELAGTDEECMKRIQDPSRDVECRAALVVPADKAVKLVMNSRDVLHSFYIPNFRAKRDVVPGRYTQLWFEAPKAGEHPVFCTEYCGDQHGYMYSKVKVLPQAEYDAWHLAEQQKSLAAGSLTGAALGEKLFNTKGCAGCHSLAGARVVGPALNGKFGTTESLEGGGSAVVDEVYLRESILVPGAKVVAGYPPSMPPYQGQLSESDVEGLIEYLKTKQ